MQEVNRAVPAVDAAQRATEVAARREQAKAGVFPEARQAGRQAAGDAGMNEAQEAQEAREKELERQVRMAVDALNKAMEVFTPTQLRFKLHEKTERLQVQVVDQATGKVIKEVPPSEFLDLLARIREMVGLFIDEKA